MYRKDSKHKEVIQAALDLNSIRPSRMFTTGQVARRAGVSYNTARKWLAVLVENNDICHEEAGYGAGVVSKVDLLYFRDKAQALGCASFWECEYAEQMRFPF